MVNNIDFNLTEEIQKYLINISNLYPYLPKISPTGVYDPPTQNAVIAFQMLSGLSPTGVVDYYTWNALVQENNKYIKLTQTPARIPFSPPDFTDVKLGDKRDIVYAIKIMLNSFNRAFINYKELEITNSYDEETQEAVRLFQQRSMLPVTGIVDINTWNTLMTIYDSCKFYR